MLSKSPVSVGGGQSGDLRPRTWGCLQRELGLENPCSSISRLGCYCIAPSFKRAKFHTLVDHCGAINYAGEGSDISREVDGVGVG